MRPFKNLSPVYQKMINNAINQYLAYFLYRFR